ncbi:TraR/DksA family transcriptional regulator [Vreelandella glaciei]|uniref:TraR/DksA family transcriptional regulator n=1 Tax=Vreelandella glaciei TaxID=186761 RepID=UPI0030ED78F4
MDRADIANDYVEWRLEQVLNARHRPTPVTQPSRSECLQCEEAIPAARRNALPGVQLCVECQTAMEGR